MLMFVRRLSIDHSVFTAAARTGAAPSPGWRASSVITRNVPSGCSMNPGSRSLIDNRSEDDAPQALAPIQNHPDIPAELKKLAR